MDSDSLPNDKTLATGGVAMRSNEAGKPSTQE